MLPLPEKCRERLFSLMFDENLEELEMFSSLKAVGLNAKVEVSTGSELSAAPC